MGGRRLRRGRPSSATMALWAAAIVAITALGALPGFLGLVLAPPLLGHATWHAYRDLVEPQEPETR